MKIGKVAINRVWIQENGYSFLTRVLEFGFGLLNFLLLVRMLSREDFGAWAIFISIGVLADTFRSGFLQNAFIRFYNIAPELRQNALLGSSFALNLLFAVGFAVAFITVGPWVLQLLNVPRLEPALWSMAWLPLAGAPLFQLGLYLLAELRMKAYFMVNCLRVVSFSIAVASHYFYQIPLSLERLSVYFVLSLVLGSMVAIVFYPKQAVPKPNWRREGFSKLYLFGRFIFLTNTFTAAKQNVDKFLLSALLGPAAVAISNVAFRFLNVFEIPVQSIVLVYYSKVTQLLEKESLEKQGQFFYVNLAIILAISIPIAVLVWFFVPFLIEVFAGSAYVQSVEFVRIILFSVLIKPLDKLAGSFLDGSGYPQRNTLSVMLSFALALPIFWLLIAQFGLIGAAYGFLISQLIGAIIKVYLLKKAFGFQSKQAVATLFQLVKHTENEDTT